MSVDFPQFIFPPAGPLLPPHPSSTMAPKPPDSSVKHARWYLDSALQDPDNYPSDGFGSAAASMHVGDVIKPQWEESGLKTWDLEMCCIACLPSTDGTARTGDEKGGFPFCQNDTTTAINPPKSYWSSTVGQGRKDLEVQIPAAETDPIRFRGDRQWENTTIACTLVLSFGTWNLSDPEAIAPTQAMSQLFIASQAPRRSEDAFRNTQAQFVYNNTWWPFGHYSVPSSSSISSSSSASPTSSTSSTSPSSLEDEPNPNTGKDAQSIGFGVLGVVGIILVVWLLCWIGSKARSTNKSPPPLPSTELHVWPPSSRSDTPQWPLSARASTADVDTPPPAHANTVDVEAPPPARVNTVDVEAPPPAYHEAVTDQERVNVIQRGGAEAVVPPPEYPRRASESSSASASTSTYASASASASASLNNTDIVSESPPAYPQRLRLPFFEPYLPPHAY